MPAETPDTGLNALLGPVKPTLIALVEKWVREGQAHADAAFLLAPTMEVAAAMTVDLVDGAPFGLASVDNGTVAIVLSRAMLAEKVHESDVAMVKSDLLTPIALFDDDGMYELAAMHFVAAKESN